MKKKFEITIRRVGIPYPIACYCETYSLTKRHPRACLRTFHIGICANGNILVKYKRGHEPFIGDGISIEIMPVKSNE